MESVEEEDTSEVIGGYARAGNQQTGDGGVSDEKASLSAAPTCGRLGHADTLF
jgi:hypothetical protein